MFSRHNQKLQIIWDATSWAALQRCNRYYQYNIIEGWRQEENIHFSFGSLYQEAVECFLKARLRGLGKSAATYEAMLRALQSSGEFTVSDPNYFAGSLGNPAFGPTYEWHPWGGTYARRWRCTGTEPWRNEKGNRAKCPYSHAGKWFDGAAYVMAYAAAECRELDVCPSCGSAVEEATHYLPDHPSKNRASLLRAVALFCDTQHEHEGLQPYAMPDGTPAIELQTRVPLGRKIPGPEPAEDYEAVINLDEIDTWRGRQYIVDNKTTKDPLSDHWFRQFAPHAQFDFYDLIGSIAFQGQGDPEHGPDIAGLAVRGMQVTKNACDTRTRLITKSEGQRQEAWRDLHWWLSVAEQCATEDYWPMNRASCRNCPYAAVCDMDPEYRGRTLEANFVRRPWNPVTRGAPQTEENP